MNFFKIFPGVACTALVFCGCNEKEPEAQGENPSKKIVIQQSQNSGVVIHSKHPKMVTAVEGDIADGPLSVCVLDFSSISTQGNKVYLPGDMKNVEVPPMSSLNTEDRKSVNSVMQGIVKIIDAWDNTKTQDVNRQTSVTNNMRRYEQSKALYEEIVRGDARPMVIGADYLSAYLGKHNTIFSCKDASLVTTAMKQLEAQPDFPKNFLKRLAKTSGCSHLIYGTLSDLRTKENSFKGYGIETKTTLYELDVVIKLVDLASQKIVYSSVYTGRFKEQRPISVSEFDNNIFQNLMTSALERAAEDLEHVCNPSNPRAVKRTPLRHEVNFNIRDGKNIFTAPSSIFLNDKFIGGGSEFYIIPEGDYQLRVEAEGYEPFNTPIQIRDDQTYELLLKK